MMGETGGDSASLRSLLDPDALPAVLSVGVHQAVESIMVTDTGGQILYVNPSFERVSGWSSREALGQNPRILKSGKQERAFYEGMWNTILSGKVYRGEVVNRRRNGELYVEERSVTPVRGDTGPVEYFISVAQDVTERKRTEAERDQYFRESLDLLAVADGSARLRRVNPAWQKTLGHSEEEIVGRRPFWMMHPDDRKDAIASALQAAMGQPLVDARVRFVATDGTEKWLSWNVTPVGADGLAYAVGRDITEVVRSERARAALLAATEERARALAERAAELRARHAEAQHAADHDALTGLLNRRAWTRELGVRAWSSLAVFDIDHFKRVNDTHGHLGGDRVLSEVAHRISATFPDMPVARIGGEEFAVAFDCSFDAARRLCEALVRRVAAEPVEMLAGELLSVTISGGLARRQELSGSRSSPLKTAFEQADSALYEAKRTGRDRLIVRDRRAA